MRIVLTSLRVGINSILLQLHNTECIIFNKLSFRSLFPGPIAYLVRHISNINPIGYILMENFENGVTLKPYHDLAHITIYQVSIGDNIPMKIADVECYCSVPCLLTLFLWPWKGTTGTENSLWHFSAYNLRSSLSNVLSWNL